MKIRRYLPVILSLKCLFDSAGSLLAVWQQNSPGSRFRHRTTLTSATQSCFGPYSGKHPIWRRFDFLADASKTKRFLPAVIFGGGSRLL